MKDGLVLQFADPQTTYERPANRVVADFIGTPPMNFIPVTVIRDGDSLVFSTRSPGPASKYGFEPLPGPSFIRKK